LLHFDVIVRFATNFYRKKRWERIITKILNREKAKSCLDIAKLWALTCNQWSKNLKSESSIYANLFVKIQSMNLFQFLLFPFSLFYDIIFLDMKLFIEQVLSWSKIYSKLFCLQWHHHLIWLYSHSTDEENIPQFSFFKLKI
jgi:hypothetical protein